ncbi:LysM peptidoglycan-binding domain-containing protein [Virgibacillus sp. MSP4-1]|uniref:LysM peptidoglycan-binding domain-containing protein n=1 Tax=Virgibacillus sp. MSP4-1 TaxID=2700081 RepID=UPI0003A78AC4|nr:LysM peptidoglycan-binding domain-containing protein [Virgibacillus sp. MSP4-1]QHS22892.1 LysM peptidoglycan-binding domain-containing protein [Virgibacillus sp. MSP4-1]
MKIHVVQKGETLREIAQKYDVNLDTLKEFNTQLSNPEEILPGMKIKVPSATKPVKMERAAENERAEKQPAKKPVQQAKPKADTQPAKQQPTKHPYIDKSPEMSPVIKEDEKPMDKVMKPYEQKPQKAEQKEMPLPSMPKMPMIENNEEESISVETYHYTPQTYMHQQVHYPQVPQQPYMGYHHVPKKPCGCGGGMNTYYMPVYPTYYPHQQMSGMNPVHMPSNMQMPGYMPDQMPAPSQNVHHTANYQEMNLDMNEESSSLEIPELPDEWNTNQWATGNQQPTPYGQQQWNIQPGYQQQQPWGSGMNQPAQQWGAPYQTQFQSPFPGGAPYGYPSPYGQQAPYQQNMSQNPYGQGQFPQSYDWGRDDEEDK